MNSEDSLGESRSASLEPSPMRTLSSALSQASESGQPGPELAEVEMRGVPAEDRPSSASSTPALSQNRRRRSPQPLQSRMSGFSEPPQYASGPNLASSNLSVFAPSEAGSHPPYHPQQNQQPQHQHQQPQPMPMGMYGGGGGSGAPTVIYQPMFLSPAPGGYFIANAPPHAQPYLIGAPGPHFLQGSSLQQQPPQQHPQPLPQQLPQQQILQQQQQACHHCLSPAPSSSDGGAGEPQPPLDPTSHLPPCPAHEETTPTEQVPPSVPVEEDTSPPGPSSLPPSQPGPPSPEMPRPDQPRRPLSPTTSTHQRYHQGAQLEKEHGRTPIFGHTPAWWGSEEAAPGYQHPPNDRVVESEAECGPIRRLPSPSRNTAVSDTEAFQPRREVVRRRAEAMLIPLDTPPTMDTLPGAADPPPRPPKPPRRSEAFTLEFSDDDTTARVKRLVNKPPPPKLTPPKPKPGPSGGFLGRGAPRRSMIETQNKANVSSKARQSYAGTPSSPLASSEKVDAKTYLLNRMLTGEPRSRSSESGGDVESVGSREQDVLSEAGTFVIEKKDSPQEQEEEERKARQKIDEVFGIGFDEETSLDAIASTPVASPRNPIGKTEPIDRKDLVKGLLKMGTDAKSRASRAEAQKPPQQRVCTRKSHAHSTQPVPANFRRDGGRFSMRSPGSSPGPPPPKAPASNKPTPLKKHQAAMEAAKAKEREAWLARKNYNPLKAAAAAKKPATKTSSASSSSAFLSTRSQSFHHPPPETKVSTGPRLETVASQEALTESRYEDEEMTMEMKRASLAESTGSGSEATVGRVLALSSELENQVAAALSAIGGQGLSASVEDLVAAASESEGAPDPAQPALDYALAKLQHTNKAFQAVNRYLAEAQKSPQGQRKQPPKDDEEEFY